MVAIAAAIGTACIQNEPVAKIRPAPSRAASLPVKAARAKPLAIPLLHAARSGVTPNASQLPPWCIRKPARTSSMTSIAPIRSQISRTPRAKPGSVSSWSKPASCLNGETMMAAASPSASATAASTLARSLNVK